MEGVVVRYLIPLGTFLALAGLGLQQIDPTARAESLFLAPWAALLLACCAAIGGPNAGRVGLWSSLVVLGAWLVPAAPSRGSLVALLLVVSFAAAVAQGSVWKRRDLPFGLFLPIALGAQILFHPEVFLAGTPWTQLAKLAVTAAVAAASLSLLARRRSPGLVLLAGAAAATLGAGLEVSAWGLAALAAGDLAALPADGGGSEEREGREKERRITLGWGGWTPAGALVLAVGLGWMRHALGGTDAALLLLLLVMAAVLGRKRDQLFWILVGLLALAALATVLLLGLGPPEIPAGETAAAGHLERGIGGLVLLALLVPASLISPRLTLLAPVLLALLGLQLGAAPAVVAGAAALLALLLVEDSKGLAVQRLWSLGLFGLAALAAAYPWLRPEPLAAGLEILGAESLLHRALLLTGLLVLGLAPRRLGQGWRMLGLAALLAAFLISGRPPDANTLLGDDALILNPKRFRWTEKLDDVSVRRVVVESSLSQAAALPHGSPVALLRLHFADGTSRHWTLRNGQETAEWAVRRADVAAQLDGPAPQAYFSTVAPGRTFFGERYRSRWILTAPKATTRISLLRHPELPEEISITLFRVEVSP